MSLKRRQVEVLDLDFNQTYISCASYKVNARSRAAIFMIYLWILLWIEET